MTFMSLLPMGASRLSCWKFLVSISMALPADYLKLQCSVPRYAEVHPYQLSVKFILLNKGYMKMVPSPLSHGPWCSGHTHPCHDLSCSLKFTQCRSLLDTLLIQGPYPQSSAFMILRLEAKGTVSNKLWVTHIKFSMWPLKPHS